MPFTARGSPLAPNSKPLLIVHIGAVSFVLHDLSSSKSRALRHVKNFKSGYFNLSPMGFEEETYRG
jgi:hypothetical protein